jgi:hypothetical protein
MFGTSCVREYDCGYFSKYFLHEIPNNDEALHLFSLKAIKTNHPPEDYMTPSTLVIDHANGHPLALEILGSFSLTRL